MIGSTYPEASPPAVGVVKEVLSKISTPVTLLDVTTLSQLRIDGHPSIYGFGGSREEMIAAIGVLPVSLIHGMNSFTQFLSPDLVDVQ